MAEEEALEETSTAVRLAGYGAVVALLAAGAWLLGDSIGPDILGPPEIPYLRPITPPGQVPVDGPGGVYAPPADGSSAPIDLSNLPDPHGSDH